MQNFSFSQLEDRSLLRSFRADLAARRGVTARILAQLAEIDERKLYLLEAYTSFRAFCVSELKCSVERANKWIRVAREARRFPAVLEAIAEGRLTRSGVVILASHLDEQNVDELLGLTSGKSKTEIARVAAAYTSRMKVSAETTTLQPVGAEAQVSPGTLESDPAPDSTPATRPDLVLSAPEDEALVRLVGTDCELLRLAKDLVAHAIPSRDSSKVVARALREMIERAQKQKYGKGVRTREGERSESPRYVSAHVRWAVRQRDGEQCTYVSPDGRRCDATSQLEYDHVVPVARGGQATVENLRMRCRGHNQFEAERTFGREFMKQKRAAAKAERAAAEARKPFDGDVVRCLRRMGLLVDEAQEAAANSGASPDGPLEERVRAALKWYGRARRARGSSDPTKSSAA
jgi:5-methylcytosine-specific restriction endonuclease McrA